MNSVTTRGDIGDPQDLYLLYNFRGMKGDISFETVLRATVGNIFSGASCWLSLGESLQNSNPPLLVEPGEGGRYRQAGSSAGADLTFPWPTCCSSKQVAKRTTKQRGSKETGLLESNGMDQNDTPTTGGCPSRSFSS